MPSGLKNPLRANLEPWIVCIILMNNDKLLAFTHRRSHSLPCSLDPSPNHRRYRSGHIALLCKGTFWRPYLCHRDQTQHGTRMVPKRQDGSNRRAEEPLPIQFLRSAVAAGVMQQPISSHGTNSVAAVAVGVIYILVYYFLHGTKSVAATMQSMRS